MVSSFIMIVMVTNLSSAIDFSFNYPKTIQKDKGFNLEIQADTNENYDIKVYVYDDIKQYSEILSEEGWKSTHFYLISVFPEKTEFKLKAYYIGETEICVQMRKSGETNFYKTCNSIIVEDVNSQEDNQDNLGDNSTENQQNENEQGSTSEQKNNEELSQEQTFQYSSKKITLNSPKLNSDEATSKFISGTANLHLWIVYSFTALCVLIIMLLSLRKL